MKVAELFEEMSDLHFQLEMMAKHMSANGLTPTFQVAREKALWIDVRLASKALARVSWIAKPDLWNITVYYNGRSLGTNRSLPFDDVVDKVKRLQAVGPNIGKRGSDHSISVGAIKTILAENDDLNIPLIIKMIEMIIKRGGTVFSTIPGGEGPVKIRPDFSPREIHAGETWFELLPEDDEDLELEETEASGHWILQVIDGKEFKI
jgi:hypothetical protein